MKIVSIGAVILLALVLGIGIGYFIGRGNTEDKKEYSEKSLDTSGINKGHAAEKPAPEKNKPYKRDLSAKQIEARLPMDIQPLKELASRTDSESVKKVVELYRKGERSTRTVVDMKGRNNPVLREALSREILKEFSSDSSEKRASALRSAIRIKQFDGPFKKKVVPLIKDDDPNVQCQALAYCGWSIDKSDEAFTNVLGVLKNSDNEKVIISALHCMAVIGKDRASALSPLFAEKLKSGSFPVRRACLSSLFHIRGCLKDKDVKTRITIISETDPYSMETNKGKKYPIRELAKELLTLDKSK